MTELIMLIIVFLAILIGFSLQIDNGMPIHLKGGVMDNLLFLSTLGLNGVGLFMCFQFFYTMSFPKKA